jgi:hypothetical protein
MSDESRAQHKHPTSESGKSPPESRRTQLMPHSGQPPATLAEYTIGGNGANDFYDISVIDGYNLPMDFSCSTGVALRCRDSNCPDAYHQPNDVKTHGCNGNSNYQITFCP